MICGGVAFCSFLYELVFAYILSITTGNAAQHYLLSIGVFLASLGAGSLIYGRWFSLRSTFRVFLGVEFLLALSASTIPYFLSSKLQEISHTTMETNSVTMLGYLGLALIGILSGMELPIFLGLPYLSSRLLGFDYLGMAFASIWFSFFALGEINFIDLVQWVACANVGFAGLWVLAYLASAERHA